MIDMVELTIPMAERDQVEVVTGNLLLGGIPSSGKSVLLNLLVVHAALTAERSDIERAEAD